MRFLDEGQRVIAVAEGNAKSVRQGREDAIADELLVRFIAIGIRINRDSDGAGVAAEDRDRMRGAVGAEFPNRRAISLRDTRRSETGKLAGTDMSGVVVAVNVTGDEVEEVLLIRKRRAETQSGR